MRQKLVIALAALAGLLIARNLYEIFMNVPDELNQGAGSASSISICPPL